MQIQSIKTRFEMQDLIADLWSDPQLDATFMFVTHDIEEAIFLGDRIVVLSPGPGTIISELEAPAPTELTRRGIQAGQFQALEAEIIRLIYGAAPATMTTTDLDEMGARQ